ncbi:unnamed protein product [Trifolium pratense]|uniref:Uncharacterized protein n=1 Tax=Trifolium pratense TaxID=57577 RepID=A0ACB0KMF7_TRIPR|nr:unnamed protein product [Trifolium pratense]
MADHSSFMPPSIPKFDGFYDHWAELMENLLRSKEYWSLIENGVVVAPANATQDQIKAAEESKLKDLKVKNYLFQSIDRSILETILVRGTSRDIWESMRRKYQGSNKVKRAQLQSLRRDFEILCMKEDESVTDFFARTLAIANKMTSHGERLTDGNIVEKILRSMTSKFEYVVCSIEESHDVTTMSIDELQSSLLVHEGRMKIHKVKEEEQALKVSNSNLGRGSANSRGRGRTSSRGRGRGGRSAANTSKEFVECYRCHKLGHYQNECPTWEENANFAEFDEHEEMLMMAQNQSNVNTNQVWFLDSGCSNHMIGTKEWLFDYDDTFRETVKLGDNSTMSVMGKGNVKISLQGKISVITDVYYLPNLRNNLLSIGQLQQKNLTIVFNKDTCKIFHEERGLIVSTPMTVNRMYILLCPVITPSCLKTTHESEGSLWHHRYGHLSFKGLHTLAKKDMVNGLPLLQESQELCSDCVISKQHRDSIPKTSSWRATEKLELVHSDICGPITPTSNGGCRYFITFTDDYSRKTWTYPLKEKSSALAVFKRFKALVENESNQSIKCLRTDRGGEFLSDTFNDFCSEYGIKRQLTAAYTPQQNGVSERKNRTLMNVVRSMLNGRNVPKRFWPEAVVWATYVINRSPTLSVKNMTPEQAWRGTKPSVSFFKVFGCIGYVHVPDVKRKKLDAKGIKCVLLGVSEESKAYKLYDPIQKKIIISRDVVFDENQGWNWEDKNKSKIVEDYQSIDLEVTEPMVREDEPTSSVNNGNHADEENDHEDHDDSSSAEGEETSLPPRTRKPPGWTRDYVTDLNNQEELQNLAAFCNNEDPISYDEAAKVEGWKQAMDQEIESIEKNNTWELVDLPKGIKKIGVKWVYKTKYNEHGEVEKLKARSILAVAASKGWPVYQLDVKSAFLHGELVENVFVDQPPGYDKQDGKVYKLKKALYGLKQAPRAWYSKIESYFTKEKFEKCPHEHTLFMKYDGKGNMLIVSIYVDDLIFTGSSALMFEEFKHSMERKFSMTDLGRMRFFLGVEVMQTDHGIFIYQQKYARDLLMRFNMAQCNSVNSPIVPGNKLTRDQDGSIVDATNYRQIIGCLMYLLATRPDLTFSVCLIARYMEKPKEAHLMAAKRVMRYLKGTLNLGILYKRGDDLKLQGWSDSDYAGDFDDRKSTSGYVFMLGSSPISWSSKKQAIVTLSTTEAEFVAVTACACQGIWLRRILEQLNQQQNCTIIHCDNSSSIKLSMNPVLHGRSKHIDVRFYFLRDLTKDGVVKLIHCSTQDQIADIMTKALKLESFCRFRERLGLCDVHSVA